MILHIPKDRLFDLMTADNLDHFFIYLIDGGVKVKVGRSIDNPSYRRQQLQTGSPVELVGYGYTVVVVEKQHKLALQKIANSVEKQVHRMIEEYRSHGEWFDSPDVIKPLLKCGPFWEEVLRNAQQSKTGVRLGDVCAYRFVEERF